jgi:hypothetical protein
VCENGIAPHSRDPFDPLDCSHGPNVYTVTEQYIKPITQAAGGMSWALMRHRGGLDVDVFITHAWTEGMYEFIDKVLASWPGKSRHAWCCMLANPQNLDISSLISSPRDSPFAIALRHSTYMLAVPNGTGSIYTRLWCAYEAFQAQQLGVVTLTASAPRATRWQIEVLMDARIIGIISLGGGLLGVMAANAVNEQSFHVDPFPWITRALLIFYCLGVFLPSASTRWINLCCVALNNYLLASTFFDRSRGETCVERWSHEFQPSTCTQWEFCFHLFFLAIMIYFIIAEEDRHRIARANVSSRQLRESFTGTIDDATCSVEADRTSILKEIGDRTEEVDKAIEVLLRSGMSTARLRNAFLAGVEVEDAGLSESGAAFMHCALGLILAVFALPPIRYDVDWGVALLYTCCSMVCAYRFWISNLLPDEYAFTLRSAGKGLLLDLLVWCAVRWSGLFDLFYQQLVYVLFYTFSSTLIVSISYAGIDRIARLPYFGRRLAQFLVLRGFPICKSRSKVFIGEAKSDGSV